MEFKAKLTTNNVTAGKNTCEYILIHHTGTKEGTIKGVLNTLTTGSVSAHFVVDVNGDIYKIGTPEQILWHAGESAWKGKTQMNRYSIGIEVVGPLTYGFDDRQRKAVKELCKHLMLAYGIKKENILRHKDVAPGRKTDIADTFWNNEFKSFEAWKNAKLGF